MENTGNSIFPLNYHFISNFLLSPEPKSKGGKILSEIPSKRASKRKKNVTVKMLLIRNFQPLEIF